jgi:hypothetical protein
MYGFIQDVPANEEMYGQIKSRLGNQPPKGLVAHVVLTREGGLRYVDVWETKADWERFRDQEVEPTVDAVLSAIGLPHDHSLVHTEEVTIVDAWLGDRVRS